MARGVNPATGLRGNGGFQPGNKAAVGRGRPAGSPHKKDVLLEGIITEALTEGMMPLELLLQTMREPKNGLGIRIECAKIAAPYCHKRMPIAVESTEVPYKVFDITQLEGLTDEELELMHSIMLKASAQEAKVANNPFIPDPQMTSPVPIPRQHFHVLEHERTDEEDDSAPVGTITVVEPAKKPWEV